MKYEIPLSEAGIQAIINGREVNIELPDGTELVIRQSYLKDMAAPVLNDRFNVTDSVVENHLKKISIKYRRHFQIRELIDNEQQAPQNNKTKKTGTECTEGKV